MNQPEKLIKEMQVLAKIIKQCYEGSHNKYELTTIVAGYTKEIEQAQIRFLQLLLDIKKLPPPPPPDNWNTNW